MLEVVQQTQESPSQWLWRVDPSARRGRAVSDTQGRERWWNSLGSDTRQRLRMSVTAMRRVQPTLPDAQKLVWWQKLTPDQRQFFRYKFGRTGDRDDLIDDVKKVFGIYKESGVAFGYVGGIADQFTAQAKNYATGQVDKYVSGAKNYATGQVDKYVSGAKDYATGQVNKYVSGAKDYATGQVNKYIPPGVSAEVQRAVTGGVDKYVSDLGSRAKSVATTQATSYAKDIGNTILDETGAKRLIEDTFKKMNLPPIPVQLPTELTVDSVAAAVYGTGKKFLEDQIKSATGIPISFPNKLTSKEIKRWVGGMVPDDAAQAIEMGIDLGTTIAVQAVSGALTSALAGAAFGSVIPGLGTIVGIGVALGAAALRGAIEDALKEENLNLRVCPSDFDDDIKKLKDKLTEARIALRQNARNPAKQQAALKRIRDIEKSLSKYTPPALPATELYAWATAKSAELSDRTARDQQKKYCGMAPYAASIGTLRRNTFSITQEAIPSMGLPQTERLIAAYEKLPMRALALKTSSVGPANAPLNSLYYDDRFGDLTQRLLVPLRARRDVLKNIERIAMGMPTPAQAASLRWSLIPELKAATFQYQSNPTKENEAWLKRVAELFGKVVSVEDANRKETARRSEEQKRMYADIQKDPQKKAEFDRSMLMTQCSDGYEPACVKLRQMGQTPGKAAAPAAAPAAKPAGGAMTQAQGEALANGLLDRWLRENPSKARCMTPAIRKRLIGLAVSAYVQKTVTVPYATGVINSTLASLCAQSATPPPARPPARPGAPTTPSQPFTPAPRPPATSPWASASNFNPWGRRP